MRHTRAGYDLSARLRMNLLPACRAVFFLLLLAGCAVSLPATAAPTFREVRAAYVESDAWLLARDGQALQSKRVDMSRRRLPWTRIEDVSPTLLRALLASEDRRFYEHFDFDPSPSDSYHLYLLIKDLRKAAN